MKNLLRLLGLALCLVIGTVTTGEAQTMTPGTWTGKATDPGGDSIDLTFDVQLNADTLSIFIHGPDGEKAPLTKIRFEQGKLLFTWEPGIVVNCELSPVEGGGFSGPCTDESGETGQISMTPPKA